MLTRLPTRRIMVIVRFSTVLYAGRQLNLKESEFDCSALLSLTYMVRDLSSSANHAASDAHTHSDIYNVMVNIPVCKPDCTISRRCRLCSSRAKFRYCLISSYLAILQWYATGLAYLDRCCCFVFVIVCKQTYCSISGYICRWSASGCKSQLQQMEWLFRQSDPVCHRQECIHANNNVRPF